MEKIKFKGTLIKNYPQHNLKKGYIIYGYYLKDNKGNDMILSYHIPRPFSFEITGKRFLVKNVCQWIKLKDKDDVDIYKGDICKIFNSKMQEYEVGVVKMNGLGCWSLKIGNLIIPIFEFIDNTLSIVHDFSRIEIIGNIYENSELLNNEKT